MNDRARCQEEQPFEEGVRHQVEDARRKRAYAAGHEHVAELRDGGVSENFFDIGLRDADGRGEEGWSVCR